MINHVVLNIDTLTNDQLKAKHIYLQREIESLIEMLSEETSTNPNRNN